MHAFIGRLAHLEPGLDLKHDVQRQDMDKALFEKRTESADVPPTKVLFGPFCLLPTQFLLLEGGKPVPLGSRALEILIALLERRGELVSKQDLMTRVWPNVFVEPANLTVHMSALRRTLRDGRDGHRFARDLILVAFAVWLGVCVFAAKLLDGYRAYAAVLSGYTVAFIATQQIDNPRHVFESGMARGAAIVVGVLSIAVANTLMFAPDRRLRLVTQLAAIHRRVRLYASAALRGAPSDSTTFLTLLREMVALRPETSPAAIAKSRFDRRREPVRECAAPWTS